MVLGRPAGQRRVGRQALDRLVAEGENPGEIVQSEGLSSIEDEGELARIVADALAANEDAAERVRAGNAKAIGPIAGHVMRETEGRADGAEISRLIHAQLGVRGAPAHLASSRKRSRPAGNSGAAATNVPLPA